METFSYLPLRVWEADIGHRVLTSALEGGKEQRKYKGPLPREWTLSFRAKAATINGILDFFDARKGSFEAFYWTVPGTRTGTPETVTVRFKDTKLKTQWRSVRIGEMASVTFKEVL
jgi:phage-related protein